MTQQVERGLLSALKDGGTRLDLQLHPQELGAITLTLTARNGEVSARIRSEKSETAEMVTRQLDTIRANLEQQGIKVDKIEVQLQSQQGTTAASGKTGSAQFPAGRRCPAGKNLPASRISQPCVILVKICNQRFWNSLCIL